MNTAEKLAREVLDALSRGDIERVGPLVAEDFVDHGAPPWAPQGRAGYLQILGFLTAVLRLRYELQEGVAAGDTLRVRCRHDQALRDDLPAVEGQDERAVVWGDGTRDEMCLGILQVTR